MGRPCSRVNNVCAVTRVGVKHVLFTAIEVIAVTFLELLALNEVAHDAEVTLVEGVTPAEAQAILCATRIGGLRGVSIKPKTVVLARNHVDYARDRIGAINRRRAVFQDFNPIHRHNRHEVEVKRRYLATDTRGTDPPAIQQHQCSCRTQATE